MPLLRILLVAVLLALPACSKKPTLTELTPAEFNLSVSIPQPAKHQSREVDFGGVPVTAHAYSTQYDDVVYVFNYQRVPEAMRPEPRRSQERDQALEVAFDALQAHLLTSTRSRLLNQDSAVLTGPSRSFTGREVSMALPDGRHKMVVRMFHTDDTLIQLGTTLPLQASYNQDLYATRFRESVRLR